VRWWLSAKKRPPGAQARTSAILDHRGDWAGAQKSYADAVALAPDLPAGYYSWGGALAKHDAALEYAPTWTALHATRDALEKQGAG
jgi:hypothetical protein